MAERLMLTPLRRELKKQLPSSNRKSLTKWRRTKWLKVAAVVARAALDRALATKVGLAVVVQLRDFQVVIGPVQQVIHLAADAAMLPVGANTET